MTQSQRPSACPPAEPYLPYARPHNPPRAPGFLCRQKPSSDHVPPSCLPEAGEKDVGPNHSPSGVWPGLCTQGRFQTAQGLGRPHDAGGRDGVWGRRDDCDVLPRTRPGPLQTHEPAHMAPSLRRLLSGPGFHITQQVHLRASKPLGPQPVQRPCTHSGPSLEPTPQWAGRQGPFSQPTPVGQGAQGPPFSEPTSSGQHLGTPSQRTNTQWAGLPGTPSQNQHPVGRPTRDPLLSEPKLVGRPTQGPLLRTNTWWQHPGLPFRPNTRWAVQLRDPSQNQRRGGWAHSGCQQGWCQPQPPTCRHLGGTHGQAARPQSLCFSCRTLLSRDAPAAATVLPCMGLASTTHGLHGPLLWPLVPPPDQTPKQAPRGRSFQPEGPLPARRPPSSPVSRKLDSWSESPTTGPACVPSGPGGGNEPREHAQAHKRHSSLSRTHPALLSASIFTRPPRRLSAIPGALLDLAQGPAHPAQRADTSPVLRGSPGPVPR